MATRVQTPSVSRDQISYRPLDGSITYSIGKGSEESMTPDSFGLLRYSLLSCLACLLIGCGAERLPARLEQAERASLACATLPLVVGVERTSDGEPKAATEPKEWEGDWENSRRDALIASLRQAGLFREVGRTNRLRAVPDLIARVELDESGPNVVPIVTVFSLGLIPTTWDTNYRVKVVFRNPKSDKTVQADYSYTSTCVYSWIATPLALSPDWALDNSTHHRIYDRLALAIAQRAPQLMALAGR